MPKHAICFLTVKPNRLFYDFCEKLIKPDYDVYICIDNNKYDLYNLYGPKTPETLKRMEESKVKIIMINNEECEKNGFKSTISWMEGRASSRDKSLYYFYKLQKENNERKENKEENYSKIWFLEEDVFIPHIETIKNIDDKYPNGDLLCAENNIFNKREYNWHWRRVYKQTTLEPPFAMSMVCGIRISDKLLDCVGKYSEKYNNLFFCEVIFNTLSLQNNLETITPIEMSTILYRKVWKKEEINKDFLYHPVKNINQQYEFRKID